MAKLISFFMFVFVGCTILSAIMEGGGGITAIELSTTIDSDDTTIQVADTTDFLGDDVIIIGNERILPTAKTATSFTGCTRGYDGTTASAHVAGSMVYTRDTSIINNALDFDIASTADDMGIWAVITIPYYFLTKTLPNIILLNYSFLTGSLGIIGYFFFALGVGLLITIALQLAGGRRI